MVAVNQSFNQLAIFAGLLTDVYVSTDPDLLGEDRLELLRCETIRELLDDSLDRFGPGFMGLCGNRVRDFFYILFLLALLGPCSLRKKPIRTAARTVLTEAINAANKSVDISYLPTVREKHARKAHGGYWVGWFGLLCLFLL